nr:MAG TPA: hypothetical protein [Bacteriophage sp.]
MKRAGKSLRDKVKQAEKRERDCRRRMENMRHELRRANAISDGSQIWVNVLANIIGPEFEISKDEIEKSKTKVYMVRVNADGSFGFMQEGLHGVHESHEE